MGDIMTMKRRFVFWTVAAACAAMIGVIVPAGSASAWDHDDEVQEGRPCYVRVRPKVVHRTIRRRILIRQGLYESEYKAPLYGEVISSSLHGRGDPDDADDYGSDGRMMLRPYRNISIYRPARYRWVTERVAVQPEGYVWRKVSRHCR
jgi:hypothetical protein